MTVFVVDASVVVKWFVYESQSEAARMLLREDHQYLAPDLLYVEVANVISTKVRSGHLSSADGQRVIDALRTSDVETIAGRALMRDAYAISTLARCRAYDAMYIALAAGLETQLITADQRLAAAVAVIPPLSRHVCTLESFCSL